LNGIPAAKVPVWAAFATAGSVESSATACDGALSVFRAAALTALFLFEFRREGGVVVLGIGFSELRMSDSDISVRARSVMLVKGLCERLFERLFKRSSASISERATSLADELKSMGRVAD